MLNPSRATSVTAYDIRMAVSSFQKPRKSQTRKLIFRLDSLIFKLNERLEDFSLTINTKMQLIDVRRTTKIECFVLLRANHSGRYCRSNPYIKCRHAFNMRGCVSIFNQKRGEPVNTCQICRHVNVRFDFAAAASEFLRLCLSAFGCRASECEGSKSEGLNFQMWDCEM